MTRNFSRTIIIALFGFGLTLLAVGLTPLLMAQAQEATPEPTAETGGASLDLAPPTEEIVPTGNNSYCMLCHNVPWRTRTLDDGSLLNLYVSADTIRNSVHGATDKHPALGCVDCHRDMPFPHFLGELSTDMRSFVLNSVTMCVGCHEEQATELDGGRHAEAIRAGNTQSAVCTDCHGAHDVAPVIEQPGLAAGVCGDCHTTTLAEFRASPHVEIGPLGCASCHSPHSQLPRVGTLDEPDATCINCHDEQDMPLLLVHQQHADGERPVNCVDCHMNTGHANDQLVGFDPDQTATGHSMFMETTACTTCHESLVASGEWETLTADTTAEETASAETAEAVTVSAEAAETEQANNYIELVQGLILGLGFGVTFGAVFVARGNRSSAPREADAEESDESNEGHH
ncbi:MAG: hypothetical protein JNL42_20365 [Anaerolineae bacterium]|nr:hypothetical protein [Anaerolineae bacterium]